MHFEEQVGSAFDPKTFSNAQAICKSITSQIANSLRSGMSEMEGQQLIKSTFAQIGVEKFWHPSKFRMASDTTKTFRELPDPNLRWTDSEIFFLDIGPVIQGHEADFGQTFYTGANPQLQLLQKAAEDVWLATATAWREKKLTGRDLYSFAQTEATRHGLVLDNRMNGHRLGDFPHALHSKKKLEEFDQNPSPQRWVLEIHVVNQALCRGAFFEDIL